MNETSLLPRVTQYMEHKVTCHFYPATHILTLTNNPWQLKQMCSVWNSRRVDENGKRNQKLVAINIVHVEFIYDVYIWKQSLFYVSFFGGFYSQD